ncbi:hypothetical protein AMES_6964 [Amycolatopsis mediterranei S699]|uniref:Uncharacterized protein n=2 Tax=Amycolatopsis mediterranei TaxID=33910 RepID=A0A0H3DCZ2_AMYMU|nr:hypothetical protein [Amycolatopsis mediterranei]ADJ48790.1 hypothetical protein AMED_7072 [Amycolatopsis mediterranei U32]AEK45730.1 hypothetical protein RAM_36285 [Amycolatopsis mediterranei S699]AFO80499.1 hypothetical protein AMES_6964 [Amycolatopsis mediterranei S699]AGT87627.1 hypothetical protein B737_6964 [Amycolatopsis mediterranei RB]KDO04007.1 hypothetical protein DV26_45815 [Amycolatopsis mediterranei]
MTTRGWYKERTLTTVDTVGREVSVTTGLTRDPEGRLVAAIAISDGPTAIYRYSGDAGELTELVTNAADTVKELRKLTGAPPTR